VLSWIALRIDLSLKGSHKKTNGGDKGYETIDILGDLRVSGIMPHVVLNISRLGRSSIDGRTDRDQGYGQSINARKRIKQVFGWIKQIAGIIQLKARGRSKVGAVFRLHLAAYNQIRIANLLRAQSQHGVMA
jgi:hypothetical protein